MNTSERSLVLIKPDAIEKDVVSLIRNGIKTAELRVIQIGTITFDFETLRMFYNISEIRYPRADVERYLCAKLLSVWIVEGDGSISKMIVLKDALRVIYGTCRLRNLLHCPSSEDEFHLQYDLFKRFGTICGSEQVSNSSL